MEEIFADLRFQEIHICLIIRLHTGNITPVIFQFVSVNLFQIFVTDQNIGYEIKPMFFHALLQHLDELSSAQHIDTGRNRMRLSHHWFFFKINDSGFFIHLYHTKTADIFCCRHIFTHDGNVCLFLNMVIQHFVVIQFVHAVAACHDDIWLMASFQEINILCQRICRTAVPVTVVCGDRRCKNIQTTLFSTKIPPF